LSKISNSPASLTSKKKKGERGKRKKEGKRRLARKPCYSSLPKERKGRKRGRGGVGRAQVFSKAVSPDEFRIPEIRKEKKEREGEKKKRGPSRHNHPRSRV